MTPQQVALLIGALLIGFLLGWLITGLPPRRKLSEVSSQSSDLDSRLNQVNKTLTASQAHERELQSSLDACNTRLREALAEVATLQEVAAVAHRREQELQGSLDAATADLDKAKTQYSAMRDALAAREAEASDAKLQLSSLRNTAHQGYTAYNSQVQSLQAEVKRLTEVNETLKINLEGTAGDLAKARTELEGVNQSLANKDTALTEAYARAVRLERETSDEQTQLLALQAEAATLKRNLSALQMSNQDLTTRLEHARGEVANELAALTSTMLRVKDEQLAQANATIAALQAQMSAKVGHSGLG